MYIRFNIGMLDSTYHLFNYVSVKDNALIGVPDDTIAWFGWLTRLLVMANSIIYKLMLWDEWDNNTGRSQITINIIINTNAVVLHWFYRMSEVGYADDNSWVLYHKQQ